MTIPNSTKQSNISQGFTSRPPTIFKSSMSSTSSRRAKSSMNFAYLPKHRVRTKFKPSNPPHYFYTALPNDSFISDVDDLTPSPPSLSPTPTTPSTSKPSPHNHRLTSAISLTLQNSGSVARDHLASERTFLAYMRTSLALASAGVGLVQLFTVATVAGHVHSGHRLHIYIQPLGAAAIVLGLVVLMIGITRYFTVQAELTKGNFPVARIVTVLMTLALTVLTTLTFGILMAGKLGLREKP